MNGQALDAPMLLLGSIASSGGLRLSFAGIHFARSLPELEAVGTDPPRGDLRFARQGPPLTSKLQSAPGTDTSKHRGVRIFSAPGALPDTPGLSPGIGPLRPDGGDAGVARHVSTIGAGASSSPEGDLSNLSAIHAMTRRVRPDAEHAGQQRSASPSEREAID